jgi:carboxylesterase type B
MMPTPIVPAATTPFIYEGAGARWGPVIDGDIISVSPAEVGCKVPAIFGFNANEGTLFVLGEYLARSFTLNQTQYDEFLTYNFGPLASKVNETYSVEKFSSSEYPVYAAMATVFTEATYKCPAYRALSVSQTHGVPVWSYEFSHSPSCAWYKAIPQAILPYVGAAHTAEIPFVFNTTHNLPLPDGNCTFTVAEQSLAGAMSEAWTSMAEKGQPGDASEWPQWTVNSSAGVNINESMVVGTVDYSSCAFWDAIYEESAKIAEVY